MWPPHMPAASGGPGLCRPWQRRRGLHNKGRRWGALPLLFWRSRSQTRTPCLGCLPTFHVVFATLVNSRPREQKPAPAKTSRSDQHASQRQINGARALLLSSQIISRAWVSVLSVSLAQAAHHLHLWMKRFLFFCCVQLQLDKKRFYIKGILLVLFTCVKISNLHLGWWEIPNLTLNNWSDHDVCVCEFSEK